jgi:hypothetical protein
MGKERVRVKEGWQKKVERRPWTGQWPRDPCMAGLQKRHGTLEAKCYFLSVEGTDERLPSCSQWGHFCCVACWDVAPCVSFLMMCLDFLERILVFWSWKLWLWQLECPGNDALWPCSQWILRSVWYKLNHIRGRCCACHVIFYRFKQAGSLQWQEADGSGTVCG